MTVGELCRAIIVDDEMLIRQGIKHYIDWEKEGFLIVGEASNGLEALELVEAANPHIIITDVVMPIMDGEELTRIVKERYPHIEIIILSSFGEFNYVRSTFQSGVVDYILKPKLDAQGLLKVLKTAASRIPSFVLLEKNQDTQQLSIEQIITKLLSGYEVKYDPEMVSKAFPYSHYCLLGADLKNHPSRELVEFQTRIKGKMEEGLQLNIGQAAHYSLYFKPNSLVVLVNIDKENINEVMKFAKEFADANPRIDFALTEEFSDILQIGDFYKESLLKLLKYQFYFPNCNLLISKVLPAEPKCDNFNLDWFTSECKLKKFDSAFRYLQDHVSSFSKCYTNDVFEYKSFFGNIIFNITILLGNMEYSVKDLENARYTYFKSIDGASSAEEVAALLNQFIEEAKSCIFSMPNQPDNLNMKKLMEYILNHYAESITLKDVAKHFHFNPSYLSNYFSTHNKEGFIEYLNKIRIEQATKLLTHDTISISEISGMVGYSDPSYFCKVFKKIKGVSPSQFKRKQNLR